MTSALHYRRRVFRSLVREMPYLSAAKAARILDCHVDTIQRLKGWLADQERLEFFAQQQRTRENLGKNANLHKETSFSPPATDGNITMDGKIEENSPQPAPAAQPRKRALFLQRRRLK